ncbi:hypothetical protein C8J56DRAFT_791668 [Mycena floridula]|nr:hypothetical protein C8J56DRAFT_791668 [Mycena floridula]
MPPKAKFSGKPSKKPPTFQRFPEKRARQLKQTWVQNAKIKSKWRAEKAKLGLNKPDSEQEIRDDVSEQSWNGIVEEDEEEKETPNEPFVSHPTRQNATATTSTSTVISPPARSLRDLNREAYAATSLHTFKADPLGRARGRGRGRGRGQGERGRGQPNMKLRMGALLEKIKQDFGN